MATRRRAKAHGKAHRFGGDRTATKLTILGPLPDLDLRGIDWAIVGGESGPKARPMDATWAIDLGDQCRRARVPFFFKQWGGKNKKRAGRVLEGRTWDEMPAKRETPGGATSRRSGRSLPVAS